jgi:hypothetical protein
VLSSDDAFLALHEYAPGVHPSTPLLGYERGSHVGRPNEIKNFATLRLSSMEFEQLYMTIDKHEDYLPCGNKQSTNEAALCSITLHSIVKEGKSLSQVRAKRLFAFLAARSKRRLELPKFKKAKAPEVEEANCDLKWIANRGNVLSSILGRCGFFNRYFVSRAILFSRADLASFSTLALNCALIFGNTTPTISTNKQYLSSHITFRCLFIPLLEGEFTDA